MVRLQAKIVNRKDEKNSGCISNGRNSFVKKRNIFYEGFREKEQ